MSMVFRSRGTAVLVALAVLVAVTTGVADVLIVLEAHRTPDWQIALQAVARADRLVVLETSRASDPHFFDPAWSRPVRENGSWPVDELPLPPDQVWCVRVESGHWPDSAARQVLLVAYHSDRLHHTGWLVHTAEQEPFDPEFAAYMDRLSCNLALD